MRKNLLSKFVLLISVLLMGTTGAWAEEETTNVSSVATTFSATGNVTGNFTQSGDFTKADWNLDVTWKSGASWQAMNSTKGAHVGSGSKPATKIILTGTKVPGDISSVKVNSSVASGGTTTIEVSVGGTAFKYNKNTTATLATSATDYDFTGLASGDVVITWNQASTSKAIYIKSVTITYEDQSSAVATTLTIDATGIVNTDINNGTNAGQLTATVKAGDNIIPEASVTWESDDEEIAKVDGNGNIKLVDEGTTTITATYAGVDDQYKPSTATYNLTVTNSDPNKPTANFVKVTKTEDIVNGNYLIVYEDGNIAFDGSLTTLDATSNTIDVTINNGIIAANEENLASVFTINVANKTLKSASGNYIGVSSNSNGLNQDATSKYTNSFAIDEDGNAVIEALFDKSTMSLRYNVGSGQTRFRYYKDSGQKAIQLYRLVKTLDVTVSEAEWKTYIPKYNVVVPDDLLAYTVTVNGNTAQLTTATTIPAGTPVLLNGEAGTHSLTVTKEELPPLAGNELQVSDADTGNGVFVLANKENGVGFYKWTGGKLGAGRVYLNVPSTSRSFISWGEATGISNLTEQKTAETFYDLQGRRVAHPQKGLYIMDGRKVVVK